MLFCNTRQSKFMYQRLFITLRFMDRDATVHRNKTFRKKDIFTPGPLQNLGGLAIKYVGAGRPLQENKHCFCIDKHFNYYNQVIYQVSCQPKPRPHSNKLFFYLIFDCYIFILWKEQWERWNHFIQKSKNSWELSMVSFWDCLVRHTPHNKTFRENNQCLMHVTMH